MCSALQQGILLTGLTCYGANCLFQQFARADILNTISQPGKYNKNGIDDKHNLLASEIVIRGYHYYCEQYNVLYNSDVIIDSALQQPCL